MLCKAKKLTALRYGVGRHNWDIEYDQFHDIVKVRISENGNSRNCASISRPVADTSLFVVSDCIHIALWAYNLPHQDFYSDSLPTTVLAWPSDKKSDLSWNGLYFASKLHCHYFIRGTLRSAENTKFFGSISIVAMCQQHWQSHNHYRCSQPSRRHLHSNSTYRAGLEVETLH